MDYKNVEFAGYYGEKTGVQIRETLEKYGLTSVSVHQSIDIFLERGQKAVDFFKAFGVKYITVPWYQKEEYAKKQRAKPAANTSSWSRIRARTGRPWRRSGSVRNS